MESQFLQWTKDMTQGVGHFSKNNVSSSQLSMMMKCKNSEKILAYLIKHFRPPAETYHIKLNLQHARLKKSLLDKKEENRFDQKYSLLTAQLQEAQLQVEKESKELLLVAQEEEMLLLKEKELRRKLALLKLAQENTLKDTNKLRSWHTQIMQLTSNRRNNQPCGSPQEESIKHEALKEKLSFITSQLRNIRQQMMNDSDIDATSEKHKIFDSIRKLLRTESPRSILDAFKSITVEETKTVNKMVKKVDLVQDAKALRLQYESSGKLIDDLDSEGILETVQMFLIQMSGKHLKLHFANTKANKDLKVKEELLQNYRRNIRKALEEKPGGNSATIASTMECVDELIAVAGLKSALSKMNQLSDDLEGREAVATRTRQDLVTKHSQIHNYSNEVMKVNDWISNLNLSISCNWQLIQEQIETTKVNVDSKTSLLTLPTPHFDRRISLEIDKLSRLSSLNSLLTHGDAPILPVGPMQSVALRPDNESRLAVFLSEFSPSMMTWESILESIRQRKRLLDHNNEVLRLDKVQLKEMAKQVNNNCLSTSYMKILQTKAKEFDLDLTSKVSQAIEKCESVNETTDKQLINVKRALQTWWSQPAQQILKKLEG